jgi:zinc transport system substrate-binding protein
MWPVLRKFSFRPLGAALAACVLAASICGFSCRSVAEPPGAKPIAVATIFAYYDALRAIAGPDADAQILLPPGQSPHGFEPGVQDRVTVSRARLLVKNGLELDVWADKLLAGNGRAVALDIGQIVKDKGIQPLHTEETSVAPPGESHADHEADHSHEHHAVGNPHIWLDPRVQAMAAEAIRDALIEIDPVHKQGYEARAKAYLEELAVMDKEFADAAKTFRQKEFIGFHQAYDYLAHRYGLKQVAAIEELPEQGPSLTQQANLIKLIREKNIKVIFVENALPARTGARILEETGAKTAVLQPLETFDRQDQTYVSMMRENLAALKEALK